uniref:Uncharacterized protein n=1 Tax=Setaria italica TaxID=4555 RepID=K4A277_SETIT
MLLLIPKCSGISRSLPCKVDAWSNVPPRQQIAARSLAAACYARLGKIIGKLGPYISFLAYPICNFYSNSDMLLIFRRPGHGKRRPSIPIIPISTTVINPKFQIHHC